MKRHTFLLLVLAAGCAHASADEPAGPAPDPAPGREVAAEGRARVRYDLARHFERAELRYRATDVIDLGVPGGAKHTWGGWASGVGPDREIDGASAAVTTRSRASLALAGRGEAATLSLRVRSFRPGRAAVHLDEHLVVQEELAANEWRVLSASVPAERLARGEHELVLRFDHGGSLPGLGRAYLAIDWIRLGPDAPTEIAPSATREGVPTLELPSGWTVAYPMEIPAGARLRGVIEGGPLEVWAETDASAPRRVAAIPRAARPARFDVALEGLAGDVARIELRAHGDARLRHPAVVTLDGSEPVALRRPRNVVVYLIDTLRADRLRIYHPSTRVRTPGITRFAERATVIASAHAQENWTKPSVATLLSALLPWEHTAFADGSVVPASVRLLPELLSQRGFATAGFVANGYVSERFGFQRGWDHFRNYVREGQSTRGERVVADALAWLDARPADRPFFLYVHAIDPHVPYRPPRQYLEMYDAEPYRGPVDFSRDATLLERIKVGGLRLNERDRRRLEALYDGEVSYQDAQLAAFLDGLERRGLADDTMVVITADHGEEFWDHGSVGHGHNLHAELTHVPLVVRVPGLRAPQRLEGAAGLVDVVPTILEALGEPVPEGISGRSLVPRLRGAGEGAPTAAVAGFMEHWRSIVSGRYKLIARSRGRIALYDRATDPREQRDISAERPIAAAYLRGLLGLRLAESSGEAARPRPRHRPATTTIDPELQAQLEALGYVGTSRPR